MFVALLTTAWLLFIVADAFSGLSSRSILGISSRIVISRVTGLRSKFALGGSESDVSTDGVSVTTVVNAHASADPAPPVAASPNGSDVGVTAPLGYWDPLGVMEQYADDSRLSKKFKKSIAEAEKKHGRVAMLAFLGIFVGEKFNPFFDHTITGPAIYQWQKMVDYYPPAQVGIVWLITMAEYETIMKFWDRPSETLKSPTGIASLKEEFAPGDYGFDPLRIKPKQPDALKTMINKELNNGRLAMLGVAGIVAQELVTGVSVF